MVTDDQTTVRKADFGPIYGQPDPRAYYTTLAAYDYQIPQHGADLFTDLLDEHDDERPTVLDVCCSYGIVTALLTTDLTMRDLTEHYSAAQAEGLSTEELVADDTDLLRDHRRDDAPRTVGLDISANAVEHAVTVGALDHGFAENLEQDEPSAELASLLAEVDLITTTGGIGYVTGRTFERLLRHAPPQVTVASLCLRSFDHHDVQRTLDEHGLVTEQVPGTFRQRRFVDDAERDWALSAVRARGLDPTGHEDDGYHHAQLFVSRPA